MKIKNLYLVISLFLIIVLFIKCQKEEFDGENRDVLKYEESDANSALEELSGIFLELSDDKDFRHIIRDEAIIDYCDDYITQKLALKSSNNENQIIRLLKDFSKDLDYSRIQELVDKIPNYEVAVPVNCEEWDVENFKPLIAFVPEDYNEKIHKKIKAFNSEGETEWLTTETDPDQPIILIRPKEDIDLSKFSSDNGLNLKTSRINGVNEFIKTIRTPNISAVESWITGPRCEIKVVTISSKTGNIWSTDYFDPKRKDIDNRTETVNHKLGIWNTNETGNFLTMQWYEEDGGATVSTSISYKTESGQTSTISYSVKDEDDNLGVKTVNFTDDLGIEYNTGKWQWRMNNSTYCPFIGSWDGAHCYIGKAPAGTTAFYLTATHTFYYTPLSGNQCPYPGSSFDGANCAVISFPAEARPFILNNSWYLEPYNF
ncbi:MAG TPA: hypothetical protein VJ203_04635 [Bacteroidales bacterium]|nr:hypothetical protein [Bacteroidales bacterium]